MIVDTSALVAILRSEPDAEALAEVMRGAETRRLSAASFVELAAVIDRPHDPVASRKLDLLLERIEAIIEPVTVEQAKIAREAYRDFGRGSGHPAQLNFGDCFAYALAKALNEPLLFKGADFAHTDVKRAF
ncbi:MAG: type II toxin-antitoxin system VapC family toxin [Methylobacteriaceae bacterium]|nr:type II toxin-antitoxin system VapC family toxin [Methylobacteriaceae bacterium]